MNAAWCKCQGASSAEELFRSEPLKSLWQELQALQDLDDRANGKQTSACVDLNDNVPVVKPDAGADDECEGAGSQQVEESPEMKFKSEMMRKAMLHRQAKIFYKEICPSTSKEDKKKVLNEASGQGPFVTLKTCELFVFDVGCFDEREECPYEKG